MPFFFQNLSERAQRVIGLPLHARASWWPTDYDQIAVRAEWSLLSKRFSIGLDVEPHGDDHVTVHYVVPPVALYLSARHPLLGRLANALVSQPSDMGDRYSGRSLNVSIHDWAFWWRLWIDDGGWTKGRPKWKHGDVQILDALLGSATYSERLLERREIEIHMPEGSYKGVCELQEDCWERPRWLPKFLVRAHIDMTDPVPIPGKGENSWDCGENAIHGSTFPARSVADAIGKLTGDVLATRERYGGHDWRPEKKPQTAA